MGLPIARHVALAGFDVVAFDPRFGAGHTADLPDVNVVGSLSDAIIRADVVLLITGFQDSLDSIVDFIARGGKPGCLVAVVSTVDPEAVVRYAALLNDKGIELVDSPVCRAEAAAVEGSLLAMMAGSLENIHRTSSIFRAFCSDIVVVGGHPGLGQVAKAINNYILWTCVAANEDALSVAGAFGLDIQQLREALVTSTADNWSLRNWDYADRMPWGLKDMHVVRDLCGRLDHESHLVDAVMQSISTSRVLRHAE